MQQKREKWKKKIARDNVTYLRYCRNLSPIYTTENFRHGSDKNGKRTPKKRFGLGKFCGVNDFAVPNFILAEPKFIRAGPFWKGSPSTGEIGTGATYLSLARMKCVV